MELTKEEKAFFTKAVWKALSAPDWSKDDLIDFGKALYAKKTLRDMEDKTFKKIFPFLEKITNSLGITLAEQAEAKTDQPAPEAKT